MPELRLNNHAKTPLYYQVREELTRRIREGEFRVGDMLPTEEALAKAYAVSRITVKRALLDLVNEGLITRRQGKGTFVATPKLEEDISQAVAVARPVLMHGEKGEHKLLSAQVVLADPDVAHFLEIEPASRVVRVERLKLVDDEPLGYERSYVPEQVCPDLQEKIQVAETKLMYDILESEYSIPLVRARMFIEPTILNLREARLLRSTEGMPAMLWQRTTYSEKDKPIEFYKAVMRGDRFKYYLEFPSRVSG